MPTRVLRRSPTSEKAAMYGYGDLLKDSISLLGRQAGANAERMTSGGLSNEEMLEMATAGGGMLKIAGTSKLLAGLLKRQAQFRKGLERSSIASKENIEAIAASKFAPPRRTIRESLKVPEREYGRIKNIDWTKGEFANLGEYAPRTKEILLNPSTAKPSTVWHEFTHARQWSPEKYSPMPGGKGTEAEKAWHLRELTQMLKSVARVKKMSSQDFYYQVSPIERHARGVAEAALSYPRDFDTIFKYALRTEVFDSEKRYRKFLKQLGWKDLGD